MATTIACNFMCLAIVEFSLCNCYYPRQASTKRKKRVLCTLFMSLACVHIHWLCAVCDFLPSRLSIAAAAAAAITMPPAVVTPPRARARRGRLLPLLVRVAIAFVTLALTAFDAVGVGLPAQLPGGRNLWTFDAWRRPQTEPLKAFLEAYILQGFFKVLQAFRKPS